MNEVTPEHAAKFVGYVANWCEALSLGDWRGVANIAMGLDALKVPIAFWH